jgi:hypothetical protein
MNMTHNSNGFTLVFIRNAKKEGLAKAKARQLTNFVLDEDYAPIQVEEDMFLLRGRASGALKHRDVFGHCPESEMAALFQDEKSD